MKQKPDVHELQVLLYLKWIYLQKAKGLLFFRRGCRAAEGPALEKRYPVNNGIVGSNPTLSATD